MGNDLFPEGLWLPLPAKSLISGAFHPIIAWRRSATQAASGSVHHDPHDHGVRDYFPKIRKQVLRLFQTPTSVRCWLGTSALV